MSKEHQSSIEHWTYIAEVDLDTCNLVPDNSHPSLTPAFANLRIAIRRLADRVSHSGPENRSIQGASDNPIWACIPPDADCGCCSSRSKQARLNIVEASNAGRLISDPVQVSFRLAEHASIGEAATQC